MSQKHITFTVALLFVLTSGATAADLILPVNSPFFCSGEERIPLGQSPISCCADVDADFCENSVKTFFEQRPAAESKFLAVQKTQDQYFHLMAQNQRGTEPLPPFDPASRANSFWAALFAMGAFDLDQNEAREISPRDMEAILRSRFRIIPEEELQSGDLVLFWERPQILVTVDENNQKIPGGQWWHLSARPKHAAVYLGEQSDGTKVLFQKDQALSGYFTVSTVGSARKFFDQWLNQSPHQKGKIDYYFYRQLR